MNHRNLSLLLLLIFWPLLFGFLYVMGQAGSPQPDNWQVMSLLGDLAGLTALACLLGSIGVGVWCVINQKPAPRSSIVAGFTLVAIPAYVLVRVL